MARGISEALKVIRSEKVDLYPDAGVRDCFQKPLDKDKLPVSVRSILGR